MASSKGEKRSYYIRLQEGILVEASSLCHAIANVWRIRLHSMHERGAPARMIFLSGETRIRIYCARLSD